MTFMPRRTLLSLVMLFLLAVNLGLMSIFYFLQPEPIAEDIVCAQEFMRAIEGGNNVFESVDKSGYELAYDLLLPDCRAQNEFPSFFHFFDEQVRNLGFVQSWHRLKREGGHFNNRLLRFRVEYGGLDSSSFFVIYELALAKGPQGFGISGYEQVAIEKEGG